MTENGQAGLEQKKYNFLASTTTEDIASVDEIARLKTELEQLKNANPFRIAELALEIQIERLRVVEISNARDAALHRLSDLYVSIRQKNDLIEQMQSEKRLNGTGDASTLPARPVSDSGNEVDNLKAHIIDLEKMVEDLQSAMQQQKERQRITARPVDPPPRYEATTPRSVETGTQTEPLENEYKPIVTAQNIEGGEVKYIPPISDDPTELANARNAALAAIPLPPNPPDATLSAIVIPPPFTLHEFLNGAPASLRNSLLNYRILHNVTTLWCPEREEHGCMYTPMYKCSTNPRISTAHRWAPVDVIGRMNKPTGKCILSKKPLWTITDFEIKTEMSYEECFYNKEGVWYYAGSYKAFKLDTLSTKEWMQLPSETISAIIKETISGRKNSSPQNTYETSQLYAAGALKVACVGLQCVGFNQEVYKSIIDYSIKFSETKWKSLATAAAAAASAGATPHTPQSSNNSTSSPSPSSVKTPVNSGRHLLRTPNHVGSAGSTATGSPSSHLGTPPGGLGFGSSLWNISANATASPGIDAAAKKIFEGGENLATVESSGKR